MKGRADKASACCVHDDDSVFSAAASVLRILTAQSVSPSGLVLTSGSLPGTRYRIDSLNQVTDFAWTDISGDLDASDVLTFWTNNVPAMNKTEFLSSDCILKLRINQR